MKINVLFISSLLFVFIFLSSCSTEKEDKNTSNFLLLLLSQDRAENYDRDVQIITNTMSPSPEFIFDLSYSEEDLNAYVALLRAQIAKYPRGYWIKAKAEKIFLTKYIRTVNGGAAGGFSDGQRRSIYLAIGEGLASCNNCKEDSAATIHHELMHSVDYSQLSPSNPSLIAADDWDALNPSGFQYGSVSSSGTAAAVWTDIIHPLPGFLSFYGTVHRLEDRAIFSAAILGGLQQSQSDTLINFCQADSIVAAKTRNIISDMKAFWPFPGETTFWKTRTAETENACD
ncbi:LIC13305 family lipoprotein [Leptospira santarosai]|uniref:LIC13305 family lipoprotein n=1 Tax=Leptospira santarosai TaxID=28183 RepID=UPI0002974378|nr:hypothetical protein [Leptospira santarosai]EKS08579.1 putative lipoprotein [Leptospira santarosai str. JET]